MIKNAPAVQEEWVRSLGWVDSPEKEMATYSSILAWEISWIEEPGGPQTMGSQKESDNKDFSPHEDFSFLDPDGSR